MNLHLADQKKIIPLFLLVLFLSGFISCKKKLQAENQNNQDGQTNQVTEVQTEVAEAVEEAELFSLFDFYSPASDSGDWVEELLARLEEERIAAELSSMENSLSEYQNEEAEGSVEEDSESSEKETSASPDSTEEKAASNSDAISDVEKFFSQEKNDTIIHDKNNKLKFYEFENEIFAPQYSDGKLVNVHANGKLVERFFYDENYHLIKKESWSIPSVQAATLEKTEDYEYYADTSVISKKTITSATSIEKNTYSKSSKILSSEKYALVEKKNQILSIRKLTYDKEDRLLSDSLTDYFYKDKEYKELDFSFSKKYDYSFNAEDIPPDFKYYENGILKMYNKYSSEKGNYVSEIFFDNNFSVKTYYENDVRIKDTFYNGGKVTREKIYDKMD